MKEVQKRIFGNLWVENESWNRVFKSKLLFLQFVVCANHFVVNYHLAQNFEVAIYELLLGTKTLADAIIQESLMESLFG